MAKTKLSRQERLAKLIAKVKSVDVGGWKGFWSPPEGKNVIRILPEMGEMDFFFQLVGRHHFPPSGKEMVYCPKFTSEGELDCPVCELVNDLYKDGSKSSKALASQLRVRRSYWMNIIDRSNEDNGPLIYTPGVTVFGAISALISDPDYGDIMDLDDGIDITIDRTGKGLDTEYVVVPKRHATPLHDDDSIVDEWLDNAKDLSYVEVSEDPDEDKKLGEGHAVFVLPYDRIVDEYELDAFVDGEDYEDEDKEEEEEVPVKREVSRRKARRSRRRVRK